MKKIRVLLADDHAILREGLKAYLNLHEEIEVVAEAGEGNETDLKDGATSGRLGENRYDFMGLNRGLIVKPASQAAL